MRRRSCRAIAHGGGPCQAPPLRDSDHCLMHSPDHQEEVRKARRLGGQRRRREVTIAGAYDLDGLEGLDLAQRILAIATADTLGLENSNQRSRTLVQIVAALVKLVEVGDLQAQLDELRSVLDLRRPRSRR